MPSGTLGIDPNQEQAPQTTTDYLGAPAPVAFSSQPALPVAAPGGAGGGASTSTPTIGGSGVGVAPAPSEGGFGELAGAAMGEPITPGGDPGDPGPGTEGGPGGIPSISGTAGPFGFNASPFGASVNAGPLGIGASPTGSINAGVRTGNAVIDSVLNTAINMTGLPHGFNVGSLLAMLTNSSILGTIASAISAFGAPMAAAQLAHSIALGIPGSTVNMQAAMNENDPHFTAQEAAMMGKYGLAAFSGPTVGGSQPIGTLAPTFETAPANVGQHTAPPAAFADLASLLSAMGFGRTDTPGTAASAPPADPVAEGFTAAEAAATGQGVAGTSGPAGGGTGAGGGSAAGASGDASDAE